MGIHTHTSHRRVWKWVLISLAISAATLFIIAEVMIHRAGPILKGRIKETLSARFESRVELETLDVSVVHGLEVSGDRLAIYPPDNVVAAGADKPLIAVNHFAFHSGLLGLFFKPMHVGKVQVDGLQINIPPREMRRAQENNQHYGKIKIVVDEIVCDNSRLIIGTSKPDKDPKDFELKHIELHDVGPDAPWKFEATLTNAIPRGDIQSQGSFGPWQNESPGDSSVTGHYTFNHADLNTIKGLGGMLSSTGGFQGQLNKIVVDGVTDTPDFSLDTANHGVPLHTEFHAIVDGTSGDTYLQPVRAKLRNSSFTTSGAIINVKGRGHRIELDVDIAEGQLRDFLELAVKAKNPVMNGLVSTKTRMRIQPGPESVSRKLSLEGGFTLLRIHFTNPKVQDQVDMLSLRAEGDPKSAKPGAEDVNSRMTGVFQMRRGTLHFSRLMYVLPGARLNLKGAYRLNGQQIEFHGNVLTEATLPHMVKSRWKSLVLRFVSPFFRNQTGGASIPVKITGTKSEPKFGIDLFRKHSTEHPGEKSRNRKDGGPKTARARLN